MAWYDYIILFGVAVAVLGYFETRYGKKVDKTECATHVDVFIQTLNEMKKDIKEGNKKIEGLGKNVSYLRGRFSRVEKIHIVDE